MTATPKPPQRFTPEFVATLLIVLAYIVWLLSLPAWPSQDGPVHLYYVHVLGALLSHRPTVYSHYYTIKHLLPPYALYYYALLAFSHFTSLLLADRLILCIYAVSFVFGFRYLARTLGPGADTTTLLATLLVLNWSLGMGFVNFCLSLSLVFWAMGLWLRFAGARLLPRLGFLLLVIAITLTHPVPLLILLTFCAVDLVQRLVSRSSPSDTAIRRAPFSIDLVTLAVASLAVLYIKLFATAHPLQQAQPLAESFVARTIHHVSEIARLHNVVLLFGRSLPAFFYRVGLLLILPIAFALAIAQRLRNRAARLWTYGDTWLVISVVLLFVIPLLPSNISNAYFFTERLTILLWLAPLLAASGWSPTTRRAARVSADHSLLSLPNRSLGMVLFVFAITVNLSLLWSADQVLRPLAHQMADAPRLHVDRTGDLALVVEDSAPVLSKGGYPSWNPFQWAALHVIRREGAVLDNAPWLDSAIIPLGATPALSGADLDTPDSVSPSKLASTLLTAPALRTKVLAPVGLLLIEQPSLLNLSTLAPAPEWKCRVSSADWLRICTRTSTPPTLR